MTITTPAVAGQFSAPELGTINVKAFDFNTEGWSFAGGSVISVDLPDIAPADILGYFFNFKEGTIGSTSRCISMPTYLSTASDSRVVLFYDPVAVTYKMQAYATSYTFPNVGDGVLYVMYKS